MKTKKIVGAVLALTMIMALTACGKSKDTTTTAEVTPTDTVAEQTTDDSIAYSDGWVTYGTTVVYNAGSAEEFEDISGTPVGEFDQYVSDENAYKIVKYSKTDAGVGNQYIGYLVDGDNTIYAYRATENGSGMMYTMYVTVDKSGKIIETNTEADTYAFVILTNGTHDQVLDNVFAPVETSSAKDTINKDKRGSAVADGSKHVKQASAKSNVNTEKELLSHFVEG